MRFPAAANGIDMSGLVELLTEDVELVSDGGATRKAARKPIVGKDRVTRFLPFVFPKLTAGQPAKIVTVNGGPGFVVTGAEGVELVGVVEVTDERICRILWILNPDKLLSVHSPRHPHSRTAARSC